MAKAFAMIFLRYLGSGVRIRQEPVRCSESGIVYISANIEIE